MSVVDYGIRVLDGSVSAPTLAFLNDTDSGWYLAAAGEPRLAVAGVDAMSFNGANLTLTGTVGGISTLTATTIVGALTGNASGSSGSTTGNAATATALETARNINGVAFDGTADITISSSAAAEDLTGTTIASGVTGSSLTGLGTITSLVATTADINAGTFDGVVGGTTPAAGSFDTLSSDVNLICTGTSANAILGGISTSVGLQVGGNGFSPAAPAVSMFRCAGALTLANGTTGFCYNTFLTNSVTTQNNSETIPDVVQLAVNEPQITAGNDTITNATSLKILNAPSEGTNNYSLWVLQGGTKIGGDVGFYGTEPVAQQTGVAVTASGIHTALVNLGLITA